MHSINPKLKSIFNRKKLLFLVLLIAAITFVHTNNLKNVSAQEEITVCPLDKMVTVGSLMDQSFISVSNLLLEVDKVLFNSAQAYQTANKLIETSKEDCKVANCTPNCQKETKYIICVDDLTPCHSDYNCEDPNIKTKIRGSVYDCADMSKFNSSTYAYYTEFFFESKDLACSAPLICSGLCYRPACKQTTCKPKTCRGNACPFDEIKKLVDSITANRQAIEISHQKIKDFFMEKISSFPKPDNYTIFGDFCKHQILSENCSCFAGTGWCKSEFNALAILQNKATDNIQKCDIIKLDDLFEDKQGEILFRCKDVRPSPIKQCWPDDFFCCTAE